MSRSRKAPAKPRMGRPPLPKSQVKKVFAIRLNAAEREAIEAAAGRAGKQASQWAREVLVERAST